MTNTDETVSAQRQQYAEVAIVPDPQLPARNATPADTADQRRWFPHWSRADVQLIRRVGPDPDVRFAGETAASVWARFSVATDAPHGSDAGPDWHTVIARDRLAQFVARATSQRNAWST